MRKVVPFTEFYRAAWSRFVGSSPNATVGHQIGLKEAIERGLGDKPCYLLALDNENVTGILPLFEKRTWWQSTYLISSPWIDYGGICADDKESEEMLLAEASKIARERKAKFIEFRSISTYDLGLSLRTDKVSFFLKLERDPEIVWKGFDSKLRNQIRKSQKNGVVTCTGGIELLPEFYKVFAWKMHDLGTPVWSFKLFESILHFLPESSRIVLVKRGDQTLAGALLLSFKDTLYIPSASAYRFALQYCPYDALYWSVIKSGCENGYGYFDFGRSTWNCSTFKFKKQWCPAPTQLNWQYYLNRATTVPMISPSNRKYRFFVKAWRLLPLEVANFLGPEVMRNFP
jgi:FemAB-related protein (PEP-CTERM system-associated)